MLPPVEAALKRQFLETGLQGEFVFMSKHGDGVKLLKNIRDNYWRPLLKRCLLPDREMYTTRHSFASLMLSRGEDLLWVSKTLGHKNASITLGIYAKYVQDDSRKRAKFLDGFNLDGGEAVICTGFAHSLHTPNNIRSA
jgi:integrase